MEIIIYGFVLIASIMAVYIHDGPPFIEKEENEQPKDTPD
jgi:hypothetical protein